MAVINKSVDWNEVEQRPEGRELLPKGPQNVICVSNENRETKTTNPFTGQKGQMIVITWMIEGGALNGKTFTEMLNWDCAPKSTSQDDIDKAKQAERIAEKTASNIAKALGVTPFNGDIDLFNNRRCTVDVDQLPGKNGYGPSNTFRYRPLGSAAPGAAPGGVPAGFGQPQAAPATQYAPQPQAVNPFAQPR